jgi:hypothetical protein
MSADTEKLSRSNGSHKIATSKTARPKRAAPSGTPADCGAAAPTAHGGFDSPWLGALPYRWRAQRPE